MVLAVFVVFWLVGVEVIITGANVGSGVIVGVIVELEVEDVEEVLSVGVGALVGDTCPELFVDDEE